MVGVGIGGEELIGRGRGVAEFVVNGALEPEEVLDFSPVWPGFCKNQAKLPTV